MNENIKNILLEHFEKIQDQGLPNLLKSLNTAGNSIAVDYENGATIIIGVDGFEGSYAIGFEVFAEDAEARIGAANKEPLSVELIVTPTPERFAKSVNHNHELIDSPIKSIIGGIGGGTYFSVRRPLNDNGELIPDGDWCGLHSNLDGSDHDPEFRMTHNNPYELASQLINRLVEMKEGKTNER